MARNTIDPLRSRLLELYETLQEHGAALRDYGVTPGNAWLAKNELQTLSRLLSELEILIEQIQEDDAEAGL